MSTWRKKRGFILLFLLVIGIGILYQSVIAPYFQQSYIIAVVKKSQATTRSLHPTRIKAALSICWEDFWKEREPSIPFQLKFYTYEDEGPAASQMGRKLQEDRVIAIIGDISSSTTGELAEIAHTMKLPHLSPIATDERIILEHPWTFSPRIRLKHESEAIIEIIQNSLTADSFILLSTASAGFKNRYQDFKERAIENDLSILLDLEIDIQKEDFSSIIDKIQHLPLETPVVSFISSQSTFDLYQQMNIRNLQNPRISSATVMTQEMVNYLGEAGNGVYSAVVTFYLSGEEEEKSRDFSSSYVEYLGTGRVDNTALSIYESLWVLLDVVERVGVDPEKIREELFQYRGQPLIGFVSFDENGLLQENNHRIVQIKDGEMIPK